MRLQNVVLTLDEDSTAGTADNDPSDSHSDLSSTSFRHFDSPTPAEDHCMTF